MGDGALRAGATANVTAGTSARGPKRTGHLSNVGSDYVNAVAPCTGPGQVRAFHPRPVQY